MLNRMEKKNQAASVEDKDEFNVYERIMNGLCSLMSTTVN